MAQIFNMKHSIRMTVYPLLLLSLQRRAYHTGNRIYNPVRNQDEFQTLVSLSTSNNIPLITFWTASWCPTCRTASPLIREILENTDGKYLSPDVKVGFAEVEVDAPDVGYALGARYMIRSIPSLLAFRRDFPQLDKILSKKEDLTNRQTLIQWIEDIAKQGEEDRRRKGLFGGFWSQ